MLKCPICGSGGYQYDSWSEDYWGTVERHGYCEKCGYRVEQAYSPVFEAYMDVKKGFKAPHGYVKKNIRKHKRYRRKCNAPKLDINPIWVWMV